MSKRGSRVHLQNTRVSIRVAFDPPSRSTIRNRRERWPPSPPTCSKATRCARRNGWDQDGGRHDRGGQNPRARRCERDTQHGAIESRPCIRARSRNRCVKRSGSNVTWRSKETDGKSRTLGTPNHQPTETALVQKVRIPCTECACQCFSWIPPCACRRDEGACTDAEGRIHLDGRIRILRPKGDWKFRTEPGQRRPALAHRRDADADCNMPCDPRD